TLQQQVLIAWRDEHLAHHHGVATLGLLDRDVAQAVETPSEVGSEQLGHVLDDNHARTVDAQRLQHYPQRFGATGGSTDENHFLGGLRRGPLRWRRQDGVGGQFRLMRLRRAWGTADARHRRGLDHVTDPNLRFHEEFTASDLRFEDDVNG